LVLVLAFVLVLVLVEDSFRDLGVNSFLREDVVELVLVPLNDAVLADEVDSEGMMMMM
jgi:hypothetical protein